MSLSMYSSSVPVFQHYLKNLANILQKGSDYVAEKKLDEKVLTSARLFPDMFPLSRQVQIACDMAKGCGARLAGVEAPKFEDTETTFEELRARIDKTSRFLDTLDAAAIDGSEQKQIKLKAGPRELEFAGDFYLRNWALPNVFFHITTTYNILRHNGVPVGKSDFLG
ncbi:MAG: DUF1993 domain-containing protein [Pseudomonadales bacterium]|jgi:hypothetical protein|nr:DUF1993 domain-containing protein [Pseudomonadales bacterium]